MTARARDRLLFGLAGLLGVGVWFGLNRLLGPPVLLVACGVLGYFGARAPWRWGAVAAGSELALFALSGAGRARPGFTLGVLYFVLVGALAALAAYAGAGVRRLARRPRGRKGGAA